MRKVLFLLIFILLTGIGYGSIIIKTNNKAKPVKPAILQADTSGMVNVRHLNADSLEVYRKKPEFQYREETADLSWWSRFWRWFWHWIQSLFHFGPNVDGSIFSLIWHIIKILFIGAGITALIFFIWKSIGINLLSIFRREPAPTPVPYSEFFEDINAIDFDTEIDNAVAKRNYRFAVRLLYLKCLKQLSDANLITWQIDKTNSAYINELINEEQRNAFKLLTRRFEYVWYGEFLIDGAIYKTIDTSFRDFNRQVA